jgi:uncharacterized protein (DUF169 family)
MENIKDYKKAGDDLYHKLHLPTFPVAIKYIKDISEIPEGVIRPSAQGQKWSLCQAITSARRWGWHIAMTAEDNFCVPASALHRWVEVSPEHVIESQVKQGWHRDKEAETRRFQVILEFIGKENLKKLDGYIGFTCSPLPETLVVPDTVCAYGSGAQIMHIIHALSYDAKHTPRSYFEGFGEACFKGGLLPFASNIPQIVIPGMGDRSFGGVEDHEIAVGFPGTLLSYVMENLFKTGDYMNIGQPLKKLLPMNLTEKLTPGFDYLHQKIQEHKKK